MRNHGQIWLLAFALLVCWDGPAEAAARGSTTPDAGDARTPVLVAHAALPAAPWTQAVDHDPGLHPGPTVSAAAAPAAPPALAPLHARARDGRSFRRPFSHTVSYRTTAPPSRIA